jgi:hypothetical protein
LVAGLGDLGRLSVLPGVCLKRRIERRRLGDVAGLVRDRRRGDGGDDLEEVIPAEAGREETMGVLVAETPALFDHRLRQAGKRGEMEAARRPVSETRTPAKRIAQRCGFGSEETMRRSFLRLLTVTPQDYRSRFTF